MFIVVIPFTKHDDKTHKAIKYVILSAAESKNLRIMIIFAVKSVPRSFDSLRSLRMTTPFFGVSAILA